MLLLIPTGAIQLIIGGTLFSNVSVWVLEVLNILFGLTVVFIMIVLVLENDDPVHTLAWILVLLYIPIVGFVLYLFFGRNWRKTRLFNRKGAEDLLHMEEFREWVKHDRYRCHLTELQNKLCNLLDNNSKAILSCKNKVEILSDTTIALNSICADIASAKKYIYLEYFAISNDETGRLVKDLLISKAREGLDIHFIYDDVGSWNVGHRFKADLINAGVKFTPFMPVWIPFLNSKLNYRNHRKLVIIDGVIGYLGGMNIGNKYLGKSKYFGYWRDSLVKLEGESVISLQAAFLMDWFFVSKSSSSVNLDIEPLKQSQQVTALEKVPVQIVSSGPDTDHASILQVFFSAISNARTSIRITSPYLILNSSLLMALKTAALSGVSVQIILPGKQDHFIVFWGSKSYYKELLETGIEIYEYQNGFVHAKVLIVDDEVLSIGTVNMDLRSFNQNFEITAMIYDSDTASQALRHFNQDLENCLMIDLEKFNKRSVLHKGLESLCRLFSPLL